MAQINLSKMSLAELTSLKKDVEKAISGFKDRQRREAKKALEAVAAKHGMSMEEIIGTEAKRRKSKAAAKYRNPADASQTWSGRGRQPGWYKDAIASGKTPESMTV